MGPSLRAFEEPTEPPNDGLLTTWLAFNLRGRITIRRSSREVDAEPFRALEAKLRGREIFREISRSSDFDDFCTLALNYQVVPPMLLLTLTRAVQRPAVPSTGLCSRRSDPTPARSPRLARGQQSARGGELSRRRS